MSAPRRDLHYLGDVVEAMQRIVTYTAPLSYEQFLADTKTQDAVIRNLQVVGEAAKKLSPAMILCGRYATNRFQLSCQIWSGFCRNRLTFEG